jgi:hypothetical protein
VERRGRREINRKPQLLGWQEIILPIFIDVGRAVVSNFMRSTLKVLITLYKHRGVVLINL